MFFFFNDTATTEIYTLSLHDALPISSASRWRASATASRSTGGRAPCHWRRPRDRKSTRLNSSHANISYAVFCLKKKKLTRTTYAAIHTLSELPYPTSLRHELIARVSV